MSCTSSPDLQGSELGVLWFCVDMAYVCTSRGFQRQTVVVAIREDRCYLYEELGAGHMSHSLPRAIAGLNVSQPLHLAATTRCQQRCRGVPELPAATRAYLSGAMCILRRTMPPKAVSTKDSACTKPKLSTGSLRCADRTRLPRKRRSYSRRPKQF